MSKVYRKCETLAYQSDTDRSSRERDYRYAHNRIKLIKRDGREHTYDLYARIYSTLDRPRHKAESPLAITWNNGLREEFKTLVRQWRKDTRHISSLTRMITHRSYRRIMGMGQPVLPLLLQELNERPDHWLVALNAITGEDPAPAGSTFSEAVEAWLAWGHEKGYLD